MAVYTLENISFESERDRIIARARIMKDGMEFQDFSVSLKRTTDAVGLSKAVASYARDIIIHDTLTAETFVRAAEWLGQQSWKYG